MAESLTQGYLDRASEMLMGLNDIQIVELFEYHLAKRCGTKEVDATLLLNHGHSVLGLASEASRKTL